MYRRFIITSTRWRAIALVALPTLLLAFARTASTHEPITTKVMFNKEVIRIFERNCLECHAPGKIKADIPLTTYEEARPWAKAIKEEILEKRMPPFQALRGYVQLRHDYALPQREAEIITSWVEGGAPKGEVKDYPVASIERLKSGKVWKLGEPDLMLQPESEAKVAATGEDETRCFLLPTGLKEDCWLTAIDFQPGDARVVYSASFSFERTARATAGVKVIKAVRQRGGEKYSACELETEQLGQWVPATAANVFPDGAALRLPAGARIALKVRYHKMGEATADRSRLGLYFAKATVTKSVVLVPIQPSAPSTVLVGASNFKLTAAYAVAAVTEVAAVRPLLFPFAKSVSVTVYRPDGSIEVLLAAKNYRYDWQPTYFFKHPIALPAGTRVEVAAYLDNSTENRNNPHDPPTTIKFAAPLCALVLATPMKDSVATQR